MEVLQVDRDGTVRHGVDRADSSETSRDTVPQRPHRTTSPYRSVTEEETSLTATTISSKSLNETTLSSTPHRSSTQDTSFVSPNRTFVSVGGPDDTFVTPGRSSVTSQSHASPNPNRVRSLLEDSNYIDQILEDEAPQEVSRVSVTYTSTTDNDNDNTTIMSPLEASPDHSTSALSLPPRGTPTVKNRTRITVARDVSRSPSPPTVSSEEEPSPESPPPPNRSYSLDSTHDDPELAALPGNSTDIVGVVVEQDGQEHVLANPVQVAEETLQNLNTTTDTNNTSGEWNVENVATSVNRAFHKFKDLATPYLPAESPIPDEALMQQLNVQDLVKGIVASSEENLIVQVPTTEEEKKEETSKPPVIPSNSRHRAPTPIARSSSQVREPSPTPSHQPTHASSSSSPHQNHMTPMMRMRNPDFQEAVTAPEESSPSPPPRGPEEDEEFRLAKSRKWKERKKQVDRQKEEERRALEGRRRKKRSRSKRKDNVLACNDGVWKRLEVFVANRCGNFTDILTADIESVDSGESSEEEDSEEDSERRQASDNKAANNEENTPNFRDPLSDPRLAATSPPTVVREVKPPPQGGRPPLDPRATPTKPPRSPIPANTPGGTTISTKSSPARSASGDRNIIQDFIQVARDDGIEMLLHKKIRKQALARPVQAQAYLCDGKQRSGGHFTGPWLVWDTEDRKNRKGVDLFDIRSLDKASALQLEQYPLAIPGRSLFLRLNEGTDHVFEMRDEESALKFVHGMRWVIARLAFNLIIGNMNVSCEMLQLEGRHGAKRRDSKGPSSRLEESQWNTAMNDLTNHLVDKSAAAM